MSITLSVPPSIVQDVRAYASQRGTSLNQLIRDYLTSLVRGNETSSQRAEAFAQFAKQHGVKCAKTYRFRRQDAYDEEIG